MIITLQCVYYRLALMFAKIFLVYCDKDLGSEQLRTLAVSYSDYLSSRADKSTPDQRYRSANYSFLEISRSDGGRDSESSNFDAIFMISSSSSAILVRS